MSERRKKTAEILGHLENFLPAVANFAGVGEYAKPAQLVLGAVIYALGRGKSPDELAAELRAWVDQPAARVDVDSIAEDVKRDAEGES